MVADRFRSFYCIGGQFPIHWLLFYVKNGKGAWYLNQIHVPAEKSRCHLRCLHFGNELMESEGAGNYFRMQVPWWRYVICSSLDIGLWSHPITNTRGGSLKWTENKWGASRWYMAGKELCVNFSGKKFVSHQAVQDPTLPIISKAAIIKEALCRSSGLEKEVDNPRAKNMQPVF